MALPKIDVPVYELTLPLSKKQISFRPFLVKEQKNLFMALEADDTETIEKNIKQVLINCTLTPDVEIDELPILDIEYYFLNLRARSVGEVVDLRYRCNNVVESKECNNIMETNVNIFDINVEQVEGKKQEFQLTDKLVVKLNYPKFSVIKSISDDDGVDVAVKMITDSIDYIYDGEQFYYAKDTPKSELVEFVESLNQKQFNVLEEFFDNLPRLNKNINVTCSKCGFEHTIFVEGLESFFA